MTNFYYKNPRARKLVDELNNSSYTVSSEHSKFLSQQVLGESNITLVFYGLLFACAGDYVEFQGYIETPSIYKKHVVPKTNIELITSKTDSAKDLTALATLTTTDVTSYLYKKVSTCTKQKGYRTLSNLFVGPKINNYLIKDENFKNKLLESRADWHDPLKNLKLELVPRIATMGILPKQDENAILFTKQWQEVKVIELEIPLGKMCTTDYLADLAMNK